MNLKRVFLGLPFLIKSAGFRSTSSIQIEEEILPSKLTAGKQYRVKFFFTKKAYKGKPPTILLTHGMSGFGIDDPRILDVAFSLAACGYNIVVPEFVEIKALRITEESVINIKDILLIILEQERINTKSIGFFSISFSAGFGLVALTDPEVASYVKSVIVVGSFAELLETCSFAIGNYLKDDYPTNILFYNFLYLIYDDASALTEIFYQAALDNGLSRREEDKIAPILYQKLNKRHKEIFDRVRVDSEFRMQLVDKIKHAYAKPAKLASPIYSIEKMKAPVCILHGRDDKVISENESLKLASKMKECKLEYKLEITGLLSHGDKVSAWKEINGLSSLSSTFGYFFENLSEIE